MPNGEAPEGGGSFLTRKMGGIPAWVWLGGAAVLAYFLFFRGSSSSATPSTSGGGGSITTGATAIKKGAVRVNISQSGPDDNEQPGPHPGHHDKTVAITVPKNETFKQLGDSRHWNDDAFEFMQQYVQPKGSTYVGQILKPSMKLHKGDVIYRPSGDIDPRPPGSFAG